MSAGPNNASHGVVSDRIGDGAGIDDAMLAELALSASEPDPFADDAVPFGRDVSHGAELLPEWYMPIPQMSAAERSPRRMFTVGLIVVSLLALNGAGLCVTYGLPEIAW